LSISDRPSKKIPNQRSPIHPSTSDRLYKKINQPAIAYPSHKQRSPPEKTKQTAIRLFIPINSDRPSKNKPTSDRLSTPHQL